MKSKYSLDFDRAKGSLVFQVILNRRDLCCFDSEFKILKK